MNFLLPQQDVLSMHCSCNEGSKGDVALFFGLPVRGRRPFPQIPIVLLSVMMNMAGGDNGVFNVEGGCYAKCIDLTEDSQPEIYRAVRFGAVMENVVVDPKTGAPDFSDNTITENTRVAYP